MRIQARTHVRLAAAALGIILLLSMSSCGPTEKAAGDTGDIRLGSRQVNDPAPASPDEDSPTADENGQSALVGDLVWEDLNENGVQDEGEPGLANVQIVLLSAAGEVIADTLSDENGAFHFTLPDGAAQYQLRVVSPEGYAVTAPLQGEDEAVDNNAGADELTGLFSALELTNLDSVDIGLVASQGTAELCPLTGLPVAEGELGLAPLAISLSHFPPNATRPPTGLTWAPWVFELYTGEGQTRLLSLFYCGFGDLQQAIETQQVDTGLSVDDVRIEGVRSGRVIYGDIAKYFAAALIQGGSDQTNVAPAIQELVCANAYGNDPDDIGSGGMSIERLLRLAEECRELIGDRELASYLFDATPPAGGQAASEFQMIYNIGNQTHWVYDGELGGYVRYQNGANSPAEFEIFTLSTDRLTDAAIVRENVILMGVEHAALNSGETIFDLVNFNFSVGPARLFRDGQVYEICWNTLNTQPDQKQLQPIRFTDCNGSSIALAPGSTWVNVVNLGDQFLQEIAPGVWKTSFRAPRFQ